MNSQNLSWFPILCFLPFLNLLLVVQFPLSLSNPDEIFYQSCGNSFNCGSITGVGYPFRGSGEQEYCGYPGFVLNCKDNIATIGIMNITFRVLNINQATQTMKIAREDVMEATCPKDLVNTTLDNALFDYASSYMNLTFLYGCSVLAPIPNIDPISCSSSGHSRVYLVSRAQGPLGCNASVTVPVSGWVGSVNSTNLEQVIEGGFDVRWKVDSKPCSDCTGSNGRCGYNFFTSQATCYCPNPPYLSDTCSAAAGAPPGSTPTKPGSTKGLPMGLILFAGFSVPGIIILLIAITYFLKRRYTPSVNVGKKEILGDQNIEAIIRHYGSLAPKRYKFSDVEKMTSLFRDKLGEGGYGAVFKGKLPDGRLVAVKVLSETKGNGEDFINEVTSISRTSHVNVVTLLGFCFNKNRRALVYEFMAKGWLDRFIYSDESPSTNCHLEWTALYHIAVGIARGLEYLHRGCSTRIVHFDIKPQNILLDEDFCPKISDFGLAKLCQRKQSIVSMLGARGTAGYIAPEVFSRTFGQVSHKSDVYSYGMLVLEMTGARDNGGVVQTSEVYFPDWIYEHLEHDKELRLQGVTTIEEEETVRKMILVGLWCIQINPSDRPPMSKVVEILEGSHQSLRIPPKPVLFSATRPDPSAQDSSNSLSTINNEVEMGESLQSLQHSTLNR